MRTKEEARRRGRNGGIKSGEVRRKQRDAKNAINLLLNMAAKKNLDTNLQELGIDECDRTNMVALQARVFSMAMGGDLKAYETLMKYAGHDPEENRKERESLASDKRRDQETEARLTVLEHGDSMGKYAEGGDPLENEEREDVIIIMPNNGRDEHLAPPVADNEGDSTSPISDGERRETGEGAVFNE